MDFIELTLRPPSLTFSSLLEFKSNALLFGVPFLQQVYMKSVAISPRMIGPESWDVSALMLTIIYSLPPYSVRL